MHTRVAKPSVLVTVTVTFNNIYFRCGVCLFPHAHPKGVRRGCVALGQHLISIPVLIRHVLRRSNHLVLCRRLDPRCAMCGWVGRRRDVRRRRALAGPPLLISHSTPRHFALSISHLSNMYMCSRVCVRKRGEGW